MPTITPLLGAQETEQSTTSTTPVSAGSGTGALADGIEYLVIYRANVGGSDTSAEPLAQLVHGATVLAQVNEEGRGLSNHWDSVQLSGATIVTGNGTDELDIEFASDVGSNTAFAGSCAIIAIPLTLLTLGTDYFFSGTDSATEEVSGATIDGWDTQRTADFTLPDAGDYLVLMSNEAQASAAGATANASLTRFRVEAATIGSEFHEEWEDNSDWRSYQIAQLATGLSSGVNTFAIEVGSRGTAESNFRRSRIVVVRAASFDQILQTIDTAGASTTSATFVDFTGLDTTYTPNATEPVVVLGHVVAGCSTTNTCNAQLRNDTDAADFNQNAGEYQNDNGFDTSRDQVPTLLAYTEQISVVKDYKVQFRTNAGTGVVGRNPADTAGIRSSLIIWGLTTVVDDDIDGEGTTQFDGDGTRSDNLDGEGTTQFDGAGDLHTARDGEGTTQFDGDADLHTARDGEGTTQFDGDADLHTALDGEGTTQFDGSGDLEENFDGEGTTQFDGDAQLHFDFDGEGTTQFDGDADLHTARDGEGTTQFDGDAQLHFDLDGEGTTQFDGDADLHTARDGEGTTQFDGDADTQYLFDGEGTTQFDGEGTREGDNIDGEGTTSFSGDADRNPEFDGEGTTQFDGDAQLHFNFDGEGTTQFDGDATLHTARDGEGTTQFSGEGDRAENYDGEGTTQFGGDADLHTALDGEGATQFDGDADLHTARDGEGTTQFDGDGDREENFDGEGTTQFSGDGDIVINFDGEGTTIFSGDAEVVQNTDGEGTTQFSGEGDPAEDYDGQGTTQFDGSGELHFNLDGEGTTQFNGDGSLPGLLEAEGTTQFDGDGDLDTGAIPDPSVKPFDMKRHDKPYDMGRHDKPYNMKRG